MEIYAYNAMLSGLDMSGLVDGVGTFSLPNTGYRVDTSGRVDFDSAWLRAYRLDASPFKFAYMEARVGGGDYILETLTYSDSLGQPSLQFFNGDVRYIGPFTGVPTDDFVGVVLLDNDTIVGNDYSDIIKGEDLNDLLRGNGAGDFLAGEAGNDILEGGVGRDLLVGGPGIDGLEG